MHRGLKVPDSWSYPASVGGVAMTDTYLTDHIPACAGYDTLAEQFSGVGMASLADDGNAKLVALGFHEDPPGTAAQGHGGVIGGQLQVDDSVLWVDRVWGAVCAPGAHRLLQVHHMRPGHAIELLEDAWERDALLIRLQQRRLSRGEMEESDLQS